MKFSESLKKNSDFQSVYRKGTSKANRYLVMYVLKTGTDRNRLGISVSKKVGNSVVRHTLTRLIRESYRLNEDKFLSGYDFVVIGQRYSQRSEICAHRECTAASCKAHGILVDEHEKDLNRND